MAGEWIKMRNNLWDDPRVSRICDMTSHGEAAVIGGLYWLWAAADEHTEDGFMPGLSVKGIDRKTGLKGLGAALLEIEWIKDGDGGITIQNFAEHNGASAKRRCMEAKRKGERRKPSASDADRIRTAGGQGAETLRTHAGQAAELEKEKNTVTNVTGGEPPDVADPTVWDLWVSVAGSKARPYLGKLIKQYGEERVSEAVAQTIGKRPADPVGYIAGILQPKQRKVVV